MSDPKFSVISIDTVAWANQRSHHGFERVTHRLSVDEIELLSGCAVRFLNRISAAANLVEAIKIRPQYGYVIGKGSYLAGVRIDISLTEEMDKAKCPTEVTIPPHPVCDLRKDIIESMCDVFQRQIKRQAVAAASRQKRIEGLLNELMSNL